MNRILMFLSVGVLLTSCGEKKDERPQEQVKSYPVVTIGKSEATAYMTYPVNIQGKVNSPVQAKVSGYITSVLVDEGQFVSKGQPMFRLETQTLNQSADAAKASIQAAQVEVNKLIPLVEKNIVSPIQLETAKANLARAKAAYGEVASNLDFAVVRAPVSGVVGGISLREGALVSALNTVLTTVSDVKEVYAYFSMNEKEYLSFLSQSKGATMSEKLRNLPKANLILADGTTYSEKGTIEATMGQVDPMTGTIQFRAVFPNPNNILTNGNSGLIEIPQYFSDAIIIPEVATFEQQGVVFVYKVEKDTIKQAVVKVRNRNENQVVVESGLNVGDVLVVEGLSNLRTGMPIKPKQVKMDSVVNKIKPIFR